MHEYKSGKKYFLISQVSAIQIDHTILEKTMSEKPTYEELEKRVKELEQAESERKRSEDALMKNEDLFRTLLSLAPSGIYLCDTKGNCQYANPCWCEMAGLSLKESLGDGWAKGLHPEDRDFVFLNWQQMVESKGKWGLEYRFQTPAGKTTWVYGLAVPQRDAMGNIIAYIGINTDITERKHAEEALLKTQQQLKLIFDTVPALIWQKDRQGRYLQVNNAFCQTVGLSENDIQGKTDYDIFPKEIAEKYVCDDQKIQNSGISEFGIEEQHQKPSGERGWSYTNKMVYGDDDGHPTGTIGFATDITERKKAEADLTAAYTNLEILWSVASMADADVKAISDHILASITRMSDSQYGFYGFVNKDESVMTIHTWSGEAMKDCAMADKPQQFPVCKSGIWAEAIRHREPLILNDYHAALTGKKGLPEGHVPLTNLLVVPFFVYGRITAVAAVANKINDYGQEDVNQIKAFLGSVQTIVERKRAEEALRESEERFKQLFDHMADGMVVYQAVDEGQDFVFVDMNSPGQSLSRIRLDEALGWRVTEVFPSVERIGLLEVFRRVWQTGHPEHHPLTEYVDGRIRQWVENYVFKLPSGLIVAIYTDTTEKHMAEEALRVSEEKYRKLVNTAPYGIQLTDLNGKITFSNPAHHKIQGYADGELIGKFIWDLMAENIHREKSKSFYQELVKDQPVPKVYFSRDRTKDGREIDVQINWEYIYNLNGEVEGIISVISDISDQKKLQTQLQQAQKMEAIGSLAGGIAHDLNNILFPISGLSEMLLDDIPSDNPEYESIEQIHKSAQRGSDLVKQILSFSRQSNPRKLPIQIQPILKEVMKLSRATIPMNIEITSHINTDCGMVSADPTQVHQIAINLITNAYHAVEQTGGTINIELKEVEFEKDELFFHAIQSGRYACITVSDSGTGIDQTLIDKIFDPYFTTKELGKGTGLGLSVVHGIVKEHGGDIRVYSEVGKGTAFHVYLPLLEDIKDSKTATVTRKYPTGTENILLIDDEEPILRMEQMMLERLGYQVTVRTSSPDALAAFRANPSNFDLVISDRGMPNMTGEQLSMELISIRPNIPVILCTGFSDENDEKRARDMGVKGFLKKPVARGDLAEMVRRVLDEIADGMSAK
jgi:PAS domain S-box-containing protein